MVESMADDSRQPDGSSPGADPRPAAPSRAPQEFVQLTLDPTITGPGMRTEDPYEPGTKLKIEGQRGVFTYKYASVSQAGLVSLHLARNGMSRAVRPDLVSLANKGRARR
jgi:hypothetical protein